MKYIFPDSNMFFYHWYLTSANFKLLANSIKNSQSILLMSEIVCGEVQNLYQRGLNEVIGELKKSYEKAQKFSKERGELNFDGLIKPYNFKDVLNQNIDFIEYVDYDMIPQSVIVERAIANKMPFRDKEKGYRDTMIWLSLLNFLKSKTEDDEVYFITKNRVDFANDSEDNFQADLLQDLTDQGIRCRITLFLTLNDFIKAKIETNEYEFSNSSISEIIDEVSKQIESDIEFDLDLYTAAGFKKLLDSSGLHFRYITALLNHRFEIIEGVEDGNVINYKRLTAATLYINYSFNLRRCEIDLTIPAEEYLQHQFGIDQFYHESCQQKDEAHLIYYCRPEFTVSFIFDPEKKTISGFELQTMKFL